MAIDNHIERLRNKYLDAIAGGDQELAHALMYEALKNRLSISQLYIDVLAPAQVAVGEMWHAGVLNIAQEHLATSITTGVMENFRHEMKPREHLGVRAAIAVLEDEHHTIGARMFADLLIMDGWTVDVLMDPTPVPDLIDFIRARRIDLLALSCTMSGTQSKAKQIVETLRQQGLTSKVLLGGQALENVNTDSLILGVNGIAKDAVEGIKEARKTVGLAKEKIDFESHLTEIGIQIRAVRTQLQMTQQELADQSELDRTYISMVENGRQNLTLGALFKIADALGLSLSSLIRRSST
ncbi:MAG: B12-binding domain-containing protein [Chloroflexota bacterium]|nr:B12-binding domain-containing protein [Chloroflexota bacterium]